MRKILLLIILTAAICDMASAQYVLYEKAKFNCNPDRCYRRAQRRFDKGHYHSAIYPLRKATEKGHPEAHYLLARCYDEGKGVEQNTSKAIYNYYWVSDKNAAAVDRLVVLCTNSPEYLDRAAKAGFMNAIWASAEIYYRQGKYPEAKKYYHMAVDKDYAPAYYKYGALCEKDGDYQSAQYYYMKSVNSSSATAQGALHAGILYYTGGVEHTYKNEVSQNMVQTINDKADDLMQNGGFFGWIIGGLYKLSGTGQKMKAAVEAHNAPKTDIDYNKAFQCLDKFNTLAGNSYGTDYEKGWYYLGMLYYNGIGTNNNWGKAGDCFYKASQHDSNLALDLRANMYKMMGDCYLLGKFNATTNFKRAVDSYLKVFEIQNIISADINKNTGDFTTNLLKWFVMNNTKVADVRAKMLSSEAMCRIAQCALGDRSLTSDDNIFSYCNSAKQNYEDYPLAWLLTGECYEKGIGVKRNYGEAYKCYSEVLVRKVKDEYLGEGFERTMREQDNRESVEKARKSLSRIRSLVEKEGDEYFAQGNYDKALENYELVGTRTRNSAKCYKSRATKKEAEGDNAIFFYMSEYEAAVKDYATAKNIYEEIGEYDLAEEAKERGLAVIEKVKQRNTVSSSSSYSSDYSSSSSSSSSGNSSTEPSKMNEEDFKTYWKSHIGTKIKFRRDGILFGGNLPRSYDVEATIDSYDANITNHYVVNIKSISREVDNDVNAKEVLKKVQDKYIGTKQKYWYSLFRNNIEEVK